VCSAVFVFAAYNLNRLAFLLSPLALLIVSFYSFTKRFTALSHWFIGLALAVAPAGAWIAVRGTLNFQPLFLCFAILFWTAGFDLIYSCQDAEFDKQTNLHSIPSRFGIPKALMLSTFCHVIVIPLLAAFGYYSHLGPWFYGGLAIVAGLLMYEHTLVSAND